MSHKLEVNAFFFNAKTDYLPYYKNFTITLESDKNVQNLLEAIKAINPDFSFPLENIILRINQLVVTAEESIENIVAQCGNRLTIDSVNNYRSNNGLIINDSDFMQSYTLLEAFCNEEDLAFYQNLYALHYASQTSKFEREYIGDAILILAHRLIQAQPENKEAILHAITTPKSGLFDCEYENNLFNPQEHTQTIETLKNLAKEAPNDAPSLCEIIQEKFFKKAKEDTPQKALEKTIIPYREIEDLENKHIAYYRVSSDITKYTNKLTTKKIHFTQEAKLCGVTLLEDNPTLALKKAGNILLDAYDSGAEVLVIQESEAFEMFENYFHKIETLLGRKMLNLELSYIKNFTKQIG